MSKKDPARDKQPTDVIARSSCIEIPQSIKERINRLQEILRQIDAQISWTKPSNIHLTLKFLGGVEPARIERVKEALERAANGIGPFEVEVSGSGAFLPLGTRESYGLAFRTCLNAPTTLLKHRRRVGARRLRAREAQVLTSPDNRSHKNIA